MTLKKSREQVHPVWWAVGLFASVGLLVGVCSLLFAGTFRSFVPVTLSSERSGLVMEPGAKVKLNGVEVGKVGAVKGGRQPVSLVLDIYPDRARQIPSNVEAEIKATTAFGAKYVDLVYPNDPSPKPIYAGAVLRARNVSTEVNTVFQNLVNLLHQVDVSKLNATLTALGEGFRGQGERIGEATTAANQVLAAINPRMPQVSEDWRTFGRFNETYDSAAKDILATINAATTTSTTITRQSADLDNLLLNSVGLAHSGVDVLAPNKDNFVHAVNGLAPTTGLLHKYNPIFACTVLGAKWYLEHGGEAALGGNGYSAVVDAGLLAGDDPYKFPENLPIVAAKGGPGGRPGCGSLPDPNKNFPVRQVITNTGFGTGLDIRPNPGHGHPFWGDFFPATRAVPGQPSFRGDSATSIGPVPYPGAPPYGAPLYGPGGVPLWPGVPPAAPNPVDGATSGSADQTPAAPPSPADPATPPS